MEQQFEKYNTEDFKVWETLFKRQVENLKDKSCENYLNCLEELEPILNQESIPRFEELSNALNDKTGWRIEVVPGLIPVIDFFELLSQKKFCSSTWLRSMKQLDYLEEPDMFHDIFGHIPLFMDKEYADFAQEIGKVGVQFKHSEKILIELQRIYWFTIEFGLLKRKSTMQIYGAGLISSYAETNFVYSNQPEILPFDLNKIIITDFCNSEIQTKYFELNSFTELYDAFEEYVKNIRETINETLNNAV